MPLNRGRSSYKALDPQLRLLGFVPQPNLQTESDVLAGSSERAGRPGTESPNTEVRVLGKKVKYGRASNQSIDGEGRESMLIDPGHKPSDYSPSNKEAYRKADGQKLPLR